MLRPNMNPRRSTSLSTVLMIIMLVAICVVAARDKFPEWFAKKPDINDDCATEMQRTFSGTVKQAYYDNNINAKPFVIDFANGYKYIMPAYLKSLDGEVQPGDSVIKVQGAFKFEIYKPGSTTPTIHEDDVDCPGELKQQNAGIY